MSDQGGDRNDNYRMPKNMQDLLRICAQASDPNNPNVNATFENLPEEKREWLENALEGMSVSPVDEMKKGIAVILDPEKDEDAKLEAIESVIEICEHIDFAIDFHKLGGFSIFPVCLQHEEAELRWQSLELVANLVQNNPYCQKAVLEDGMLPRLLESLDTDENVTVKTKALYAISCLTRSSEEALAEFLKFDGFSSVMRAMQTNVEKLKIKSAFFLSTVCTDNEKCKDILCDMGMIEQLIGHLNEEHTSFHEHLISALLAIVRDHPRSVKECLRPELNMEDMLEQREGELKGKEQFQEEYEYIVELKKILEQASAISTDQEVAR